MTTCNCAFAILANTARLLKSGRDPGKRCARPLSLRNGGSRTHRIRQRFTTRPPRRGAAMLSGDPFWRTAMLRRSFTLRLAAAAACRDFRPRAATAFAQDKTITVFAAASMKNALDDVNTAFTKATGIKVVASYAASSALAKQIEDGAPADMFVSADLEMDGLPGPEKRPSRPTRRVNLLGNKLVLIAPKDSKTRQCHDRPGLRSRQARGRRPHRHR